VFYQFFYIFTHKYTYRTYCNCLYVYIRDRGTAISLAGYCSCPWCTYSYIHWCK